MSWLKPKSNEPSGLIEQDAEPVADELPTTTDVCRGCNGPASPTMGDCCVRCAERLRRHEARREKTSWNSSRIDFY